jgi:hypothetical protein
MPERSLSASRNVPLGAARLFAVLSDPVRHPVIDGSGMVRRAITTEPVTKVGDVFRMVVYHPAVGEYETDNHVVEFEPERRIAWAPGPAGGDPAGWRWIWELGDEGEFTVVAHTYDWSGITDEAVLQRISFPLVSAEQMGTSIERLAAAVSSGLAGRAEPGSE